ncbi:peptidoglycan glycosyltransferase [bacterium C-53]|nr:peptidoglycan glycosyltransferase [Lachnospiraceae bacterium]NBI03317.1 peptidoglycan glycosyltransferase [Lachnospiraceae bacterium]RKJ09862.1 peptidoglycan glycosyltransferase [bacterium C-53]
MHNKTFHRKKIVMICLCSILALIGLTGRLSYLMINRSEYYSKAARDLHERERKIKAARGEIIDRTGNVLATNRTVCTVSVIHSQIEDKDTVIRELAQALELSEETVRKKVEKVSSIERIKSNVDKTVGDEIRNKNLPGVKVDEDYKRYYPYDTLASKVLGFTGSDNQGIIGLEVIYEEYLKGINGTILTMTDARGIELAEEGERQLEPVNGNNLVISLDSNIQEYAEQIARNTMEAKQAEAVEVLVMNPQNGEILAMVNVPEFDLNHPFELPETIDTTGLTENEKQDLLNNMWRNGCINDTYEPGSTFKIITAAAGLEEQVVETGEDFYCPGYKIVEDRKIRCHKTRGHGAENFVQAVMNSCNPVFVETGLRLGADRFYGYFQKLGLLERTGIDLPGEAGTIMHKKDNIGMVELATVSFGQSFQVTPVRLLTTASAIINGGTLVTPHLAVRVEDADGNTVKTFSYKTKENAISKDTSDMMKFILEQVVAEGTGKNAYIEGFRIGGKTATSQTLPRGSGKYIASFIGFAPAENPQVIALLIIHNPQGIYYGGTIAAPRVKELYENVLPYLGIEKENEKSYTD